MQYNENEKDMLSKVDEIGMQLDALPDENLIFVTLSPYLDQLMALLKNLNPNGFCQNSACFSNFCD